MNLLFLGSYQFPNKDCCEAIRQLSRKHDSSSIAAKVNYKVMKCLNSEIILKLLLPSCQHLNISQNLDKQT
jgi:hypothetical protein